MLFLFGKQHFFEVVTKPLTDGSACFKITVQLLSIVLDVISFLYEARCTFQMMQVQ